MKALLAPVALAVICQFGSVHAAEVVSASTAAQEQAQLSESQKLNQLFADHEADTLELNPIVATMRGDMRFNDQWGDSGTKEHDAKVEAMNLKYLAAIQAIDESKLSGQDKISYQIFSYNMQMWKEGQDSGANATQELMPLTQFGGGPMYLPQMSNGMLGQPFATVEDYDNWNKRISGFAPYVDRVIAKMREGANNGAVLPTVLAQKLLPQVQTLAADSAETSLFWGPITKLPESFSDADKKRLTDSYKAIIEQQVLPAYARLAEFIEKDYLPKTRDTDGIGAIPNGKDLYRYLVKQNTTTDLTAEEIHEIGLKEAQRLFNEMKKVKAQVKFDGDMPAFFEYLETDPKFYWDTPEEMIAGYEALRDKIDPTLDKLFNVQPKTNYVIKAIEPFREQSSAAAQYYRGSPDGKRPGVFYANTYDLKSRPKWFMETLSIHEASPGHHFQVSINQEAGNLPAFRRYGGYTAYIEGWGLYAETLGLELGMYTDPYQYFGMLYAQIWRANRLVVDTGLHAKGWTREQAIEFMQSNSPISETDVVAEVERYMAIPGQALGYMIGRISLQKMRENAQQQLGDKFDVREFHRQILVDGAMPLKILEAKMQAWVDSQK
ncbi:DUF885 domain-containing protein [Paraferrimonas haliotis]|uniref:DUF885 domain-containing protein n=1 Tax=Paraferrimonas haliotis TaxID=2013866 RepID=UPI000BA9B80E|nr:DUF885 domain-containing protein [Paraferrimonas haliotis]